jgi:hypothetical protein
MTDPVLAALDDALAKSVDRPVRVRQGTVIMPFEGGRTVVAPVVGWSLRDRLPWIEIFVAVQFLWGALLFLPGAQGYRPLVRALPYVSSLALLAWYLPAVRPGRYPPATRWLLAVLGLLAANLLHPTSQPYAGIAQWIFQLTIAAPLFWAWKAIGSVRQAERVLFLAFVLNCASAGLGLLQVYFPDRFMPAQFSSLGLQMNDQYVDSQTYEGRDGRIITRPPGLSDMPGGAAVAGGLTALLGLGFSLRAATTVGLLATLMSVALGFAVVYLTQVRSVLLMVVCAAAVLCAVSLRQRRLGAAAWVAAVGSAAVVASFYWASSLGGESVQQRFLTVTEQGAVQTYQEHRGHFVAYTVGELLDEFPLGAGVGRWGMMNTYFGDTSNLKAPPIYVEIQMTGWLLDGGFPMWLLYGGAIFASLLAAFRATGSRRSDIAHLALLTLVLQVLIIGMAMAGPVFNTQLGLMFWVVGSVLHAAVGSRRLPERTTAGDHR